MIYISYFLSPGSDGVESSVTCIDSPGLQRDGEGQALQGSLFEQRFTALDHQVKTH